MGDPLTEMRELAIKVAAQRGLKMRICPVCEGSGLESEVMPDDICACVCGECDGDGIIPTSRRFVREPEKRRKEPE